MASICVSSQKLSLVLLQCLLLAFHLHVPLKHLVVPRSEVRVKVLPDGVVSLVSVPVRKGSVLLKLLSISDFLLVSLVSTHFKLIK